MKSDFLKQCHPEFSPELIGEIEQHAVLKTYNIGESIVKQGQYVRHLPIVKQGCVKVACTEEYKEFLLYYIESGESCIYSFTHIHDDKPANFWAVAELETQLLLLPVENFAVWVKKYPSINQILLKNYQRHYQDLLATTKQIICHNLEDRLLDYLRNKSRINTTNRLRITHQEIASDLGTSREVISRLLKSNNMAQWIKQEGRELKIL